MKQWTKNNMKLLSKWRAKKREGDSSTIQRQYTDRERAIMQESQASLSSQGVAEEPFNPLACCNDPTNQTSSPTRSSASGNNSSYKYDEENGIIMKQSNNKQQQQQPIHKELFYFFLRRSWKKKLFTALVVLTLLPVLYDLFILQDSGIVTNFIDRFLEWMAEHPISGVWAYISMIIVTSLIFIPPSILIFAAGFTFASLWRDNGVGCGILIALIASFLGSTLGGLIGFIRARYMTRDIMIEVLMKRYPIIKAVDAAIVKNSLRVMVLLRLNSLIPFGVLNYVFGITGVDWAAFVLAMVGILPWQLLLICLGASAESMYNTGAGTESTLMGTILISMGIAFMIIGLVITWKHAKQELQKVSLLKLLFSFFCRQIKSHMHALSLMYTS